MRLNLKPTTASRPGRDRWSSTSPFSSASPFSSGDASAPVVGMMSQGPGGITTLTFNPGTASAAAASAATTATPMPSPPTPRKPILVTRGHGHGIATRVGSRHVVSEDRGVAGRLVDATASRGGAKLAKAPIMPMSSPPAPLAVSASATATGASRQPKKKSLDLENDEERDDDDDEEEDADDLDEEDAFVVGLTFAASSGSAPSAAAATAATTPRTTTATVLDDTSEVKDETGAGVAALRYGLVVDGHGGSDCAAFVAAQLPQFVLKSAECAWPDARAVLKEAFEEVDAGFEDLAEATGATSGACATFALVGPTDVVVAHCGDTRAVLHVRGTTTVLTRDHRADDPDESSRLVMRGGSVTNGRVDGMLSPSRAFGDLDMPSRVTGALRPDPDVVCHRWARSPSSSSSSTSGAAGAQGQGQGQAHAQGEDNPDDDFLILATDGVWDVVDSADAVALVREALQRHPGDAGAAARRLVSASRSNPDDATAIVMLLRGSGVVSSSLAGTSASAATSSASSSTATAADTVLRPPPRTSSARSLLTRMRNFVGGS